MLPHSLYGLALAREHAFLEQQAFFIEPGHVLGVAQRAVGVCGGLAGDPLGAALLVGLGVDELSMSASDLGTIKALLRRQSLSDLQALARKALEAETVQEVRALGAALKSASSPTAGDAA